MGAGVVLMGEDRVNVSEGAARARARATRMGGSSGGGRASSAAIDPHGPPAAVAGACASAPSAAARARGPSPLDRSGLGNASRAHRTRRPGRKSLPI